MKREIGTVALLAALSASVLLILCGLPGDIFVDFGPNDRLYVRGFREDFEIDEPTLIHWSSQRSEVRVPFRLSGSYEVTLRFKRHIEKPADVRAFLSGKPVAGIAVPRGDFVLWTFGDEGRGPFELDLVSRSEDPRPLGIALDWMQIRPSLRWGSALPTLPALLWMLSWPLASYLVARLLAFDRRAAFLMALAVLAGQGATAVSHKLWPAHVASTLGFRAHAVTIAVALFLRWRRTAPDSVFAAPLARYAVIAACAGLLVRLFGLFHPDFYYPDVRTHSKFVSILWTEGFSNFLTHHIENQHRYLLGLQLVSDRWVAFPYPPLLYLAVYPLSLLQLPVEDWMKLLPAALLAIEALAVFALARKLGFAMGTALIAVGLHATARVLGFRLAVASYPSLFGHFWDTLAVLYLAFFLERLHRPVYGIGLGLLVMVSLLSYAGSVLVLGLFVPLLCASLWLGSRRAERPWGRSILSIAGWSLAGTILPAFFYWQYVPELLAPAPAAASAGGGLASLVEGRFTPIAALAMAGLRLRLFYGWPFAVLAFGALLAMALGRVRLLQPLGVPLVLAASGTYLGMNFLRAGLGSTHIFQFSKDDLVVLPLVVILIGALANALWARGPVARAASAVLVAGWAVWGLSSFGSDVRRRFIRPEYPPATAGGETALDQARAREDDLVAPGALRLVEGPVGELEELHLVVGLDGERAQAEARGQGFLELPEGRAPELRVDARAEVVRNSTAVVGIGPVQQHGEFVSAESSDEVARP
jgi:hypothetical protein